MQTLPDHPCRPGGVLIVGINPAPLSAALGHYYQGTHGKRLWKRLARLGLLAGATEGREDEAFVAAGNGLTDLVKRPTASADEVSPDEMQAGVAELQRKIRDWRPGLILFAYRPPAEHLLGAARVRPGRCPSFEGVATFLLSGPYAKSDDAAAVDAELRQWLASAAAAPSTGDPQDGRGVNAPAQQPPANAGADAPEQVPGRTQRVTADDLKHRRIRLPSHTKRLFPDRQTRVRVELRGRVADARYDPRRGPDRERSATLVFDQDIAGLVAEDEVLTVAARPDGVLGLS